MKLVNGLNMRHMETVHLLILLAMGGTQCDVYEGPAQIEGDNQHIKETNPSTLASVHTTIMLAVSTRSIEQWTPTAPDEPQGPIRGWGVHQVPSF